MSLPVYHRVLSLLGSFKTDVKNKNKSIGEFVIHMFLLLCFFLLPLNVSICHSYFPVIMFFSLNVSICHSYVRVIVFVFLL